MKHSLLLANILTIFLWMSCTKDYKIENVSKYSQVYMAQATSLNKVSLPLTDSTQTLTFGAVFGGYEKINQPIEVTFEITPQDVFDYNEVNNTVYEMLPEGSYTVDKFTTTIENGALTSAPLYINIQTLGKLQPKKEYLLPITIKSVSENVRVNDKLKTSYFLIKANFSSFDKNGWTIVEFSSQETIGEGTARGYASNAIDGNPNTYWHTQYKPAKPGGYPHWIIIDMGSEKNIIGYKITGRTSRKVGNPEKMDIKVSKNKLDWENTGSFELANTVENELFLQKQYKARYIKFIVNASWGYSYNQSYDFTHIAEIDIF